MTVVSTKLRRLFADWEARRHTKFPKRSDFQPSDIRYALGLISLIDIHRNPLRFLYRLQGSGQVLWLGFDVSGKFVDEAPNRAWAAVAQKHLAEVVSTGEPSVRWHHNCPVGDKLWNLEALVLPLSHDGANLDMLISAVVHHPIGQWNRNSSLQSGTLCLEMDL